MHELFFNLIGQITRRISAHHIRRGAKNKMSAQKLKDLKRFHAFTSVLKTRNWNAALRLLKLEKDFS